MITSHVLNTSTGRPAEGISAILFFRDENDWTEIARSKTDKDGRIGEWLKKEPQAGVYKIRFETKEYFDRNSIITFYPRVEVIFEIRAEEHYHIPLLLSPFGFSTYRGS